MHVETPLIESPSLSKAAHCKVLLKLENCQPTASFKIRGIGALCAEEMKSGKSSIMCSSGGNAGWAAAYASRKLNLPCKIFVPGNAQKIAIERLQAEGADVQVVGKVWNDANQEAMRQHEADKGSAFVHPFDHPTIWKGHSTMIHEIKRDIGDGVVPGCVVASVGGGGLLTGVIRGMDDVGWSNVPIVAMETVGADSLAAAMNAGKLIAIPDITSIANTLGSKVVCQQLFDYTQNHDVISQVVSDEVAVDACFKFADDHRMIVEPACGAALAAVYSDVLQQLQTEGRLPAALDNIVIVVCGGGGITMDLLNGFRATLDAPK